jgi:hypothetical protein
MKKMSLSVLFQRLEASALFIAMMTAYTLRHYSWAEFIIIFILIDTSIIGYAHNKRTGAIIYNLAHSLIMPLALSALSEAMYGTLLSPLAVAWIGHIALDRALGFGLKNVEGFHHTHLGHLGRTK